MANPTTQSEFYRTQARTMQAQADAATLDNVRDRCLRAASAWAEMADRAERHRQAQEKAEAAKAAKMLDVELQGQNDYFR